MSSWQRSCTQWLENENVSGKLLPEVFDTTKIPVHLENIKKTITSGKINRYTSRSLLTEGI
jgi:hypothetical protein